MSDSPTHPPFPPGDGHPRPSSSPSARSNAAQPMGEYPGHPFAGQLTMAELDAVERPGQHWPVRGVRLSRSHLILRSRRMCHIDRRVVVAVHLIDSIPTPLVGYVAACEYSGAGHHTIAIRLEVAEENQMIAAWVASLCPMKGGVQSKPSAAA